MTDAFGPVDASGEPECAFDELIHYAKAAVGRQGRETPALVVKWLAEFVVRAQLAAAASQSPPAQPKEERSMAGIDWDYERSRCWTQPKEEPALPPSSPVADSPTLHELAEGLRLKAEAEEPK